MTRPILEMSLYGQQVLRLRTGGGRFTPADRIEAQPGLRNVSAGWDAIPNGKQLEVWLQALLPQGGARSFHWQLARHTFDAEGIAREASDSADAIWGVPGREYSGGVTFRSLREDGTELEAPRVANPRIDKATLREEIVRVIVQMRKGLANDGETTINPVASSGVLPKLGLHWDPDDQAWYLPDGNRVSTHIWKHEDRGEFPAEAAVESVCMRTLSNLGIRAARTSVRMVGDFQMIVSERSDRVRDPNTGRVERVHQEEWVQAAGLDPSALSQGPGTGAGWAELHAMLSARAAHPEGEREHLFEFLGASVILGHRDLHRRNVGIRHGRREEQARIELAPAYDVSSMEGQAKGYGEHLPMPIGGVRAIEEVDETAWVGLAQECGCEAEEVLAAVRAVASEIEDAFAQALSGCQTQDEWKDTTQARERLAKVQTGVTRRAQRNRTPFRNPKRPRTVPQWALRLAEKGKLDANKPTLKWDASGVTILHGEKENEVVIGRVATVAEYCRGVRLAKLVAPQEVPYLERTLERERAKQMAREQPRD